jgi:hypothetical protein
VSRRPGEHHRALSSIPAFWPLDRVKAPGRGLWCPYDRGAPPGRLPHEHSVEPITGVQPGCCPARCWETSPLTPRQHRLEPPASPVPADWGSSRPRLRLGESLVLGHDPCLVGGLRPPRHSRRFRRFESRVGNDRRLVSVDLRSVRVVDCRGHARARHPALGRMSR